jgi:hypothetical protein
VHRAGVVVGERMFFDVSLIDVLGVLWSYGIDGGPGIDDRIAIHSRSC